MCTSTLSVNFRILVPIPLAIIRPWAARRAIVRRPRTIRTIIGSRSAVWRFWTIVGWMGIRRRRWWCQTGYRSHGPNHGTSYGKRKEKGKRPWSRPRSRTPLSLRACCRNQHEDRKPHAQQSYYLVCFHDGILH